MGSTTWFLSSASSSGSTHWSSLSASSPSPRPFRQRLQAASRGLFPCYPFLQLQVHIPLALKPYRRHRCTVRNIVVHLFLLPPKLLDYCSRKLLCHARDLHVDHTSRKPGHNAQATCSSGMFQRDCERVSSRASSRLDPGRRATGSHPLISRKLWTFSRKSIVWPNVSGMHIFSRAAHASLGHFVMPTITFVASQ